MEWIKTTDKLPPFDEKVLVAHRDKYDPGSDIEYYTAWLYPDNPHGLKSHFDMGYCGSAEIEEIIYWMPIPPLPKDTEDK